MLKPSDIFAEVRVVLAAAARGKTTQPWMLSSYQVLDRLPDEMRSRLIAEAGDVGSGGGGHRSAAHAVAQALEMIEKRDMAIATYFDTGGVHFEGAHAQ